MTCTVHGGISVKAVVMVWRGDMASDMASDMADGGKYCMQGIQMYTWRRG